MNTDERQLLKEKIRHELETLEKQIHELKDLVKPIAPENAIGRISRMDAINNKSINEVALRKATLRLEALRDAFNSFDNPDFGVCVRCKIKIPMGTITVAPTK